MSQITIVRTDKVLPPEPTLVVVREFLFGLVQGLRSDDDRSWRRFWKRLVGMEAGECAVLEMLFPRNSRFHRKFFAMLQVGFDAWEPPRKRKSYKGRPMSKNFERFRKDVTILAGFYEQTFDLWGKMKLEAASISFAKMDDAEFEQVYSAVADVLLREVLKSYAGREELDIVVDKIIGFVL